MLGARNAARQKEATMQNFGIDIHSMAMILQALEQADKAHETPGANAYTKARKLLVDGGVDASITAYEKNAKPWFVFDIGTQD